MFYCLLLHPTGYCGQEWKFVALRNTCNTLQQSATRLIINNLSTDKILSVTRSCQHFSRAMKNSWHFQEFHSELSYKHKFLCAIGAALHKFHAACYNNSYFIV
jgi:hypothetical protein